MAALESSWRSSQKSNEQSHGQEGRQRRRERQGRVLSTQSGSRDPNRARKDDRQREISSTRSALKPGLEKRAARKAEAASEAVYSAMRNKLLNTDIPHERYRNRSNDPEAFAPIPDGSTCGGPTGDRADEDHQGGREPWVSVHVGQAGEDTRQHQQDAHQHAREQSGRVASNTAAAARAASSKPDQNVHLGNPPCG